jgi:uncharacterized protein (UPF0548 family)
MCRIGALELRRRYLPRLEAMKLSCGSRIGSGVRSVRFRLSLGQGMAVHQKLDAVLIALRARRPNAVAAVVFELIL